MTKWDVIGKKGYQKPKLAKKARMLKSAMCKDETQSLNNVKPKVVKNVNENKKNQQWIKDMKTMEMITK